MEPSDRQLLGRVEISVFVPKSWNGKGLDLDARVDISIHDLDPRVAREELATWAWDELAGLLPTADDDA